MILNISDNNTRKIEEICSTHNFNSVFLVDYADKIEQFLDFIIGASPSVKSIYCFTEKKPDAFSGNNIKESAWSLTDYKNFLTGKVRVKFENHQPLYLGDWSRIGRWRMQYAMGPLSRVSSKIHRMLPYKVITKPVDFILCAMGLLLQTALPFLRKKKGHLGFKYKTIDVTVIYDGGPEKDHYGDSTALDEKIAAFEKSIIETTKEQKTGTGFFIVTGPRHEYIAKILDLEDKEKLDNFDIFAASLYRPVACKIIERRKTGFFSPGSNVSIEGKAVYSDHCLSVGAGKKELWCYLNRHY